jgi:autotransporter passenger strand-loop-strand repeat protein
VFGGTASGTMINGGALQEILLGGVAIGATINSGGQQQVSATASATTINFGGEQIVSAGGTAVGTTINNEGVQDVLGTASGTQLNGGGAEFVESGGTTADPIINGGNLLLLPGAVPVGDITFTGTTGGGLVIDLASLPTNMIKGFAPNDTIQLAEIEFDSTGSLQLLSGNVLQIVENGTTYRLNFDPAQSFAGELFHLSDNGNGLTELTVVPGPSLRSGQTLNIAGGQTGNAFRAQSSGTINVLSGATASATLNAGALNVMAGGIDSGVLVTSNGRENMLSGGMAHGATVSGDTLNVLSAGAASGTLMSNRGREIVSSGSVDNGAHVDSGSLVVAGGVARDVVISGGTLDIKSGGSTGTGATPFATRGGGTLLLESSLTVSGLVAGFSQPDKLDFRDIGFTSGVTSATWTQSGTSGKLAVTDGSHAAMITLLGQYVTADFRVSSDKHGGTIVTDPAVKTEADVQTLALVNPHQT